MKRLAPIAGILLLVVFVVTPVAASAKPGAGTYMTENGHHRQVLGGNSENAWHGLAVAAEHSPRIVFYVKTKPTGDGSPPLPHK